MKSKNGLLNLIFSFETFFGILIIGSVGMLLFKYWMPIYTLSKTADKEKIDNSLVYSVESEKSTMSLNAALESMVTEPKDIFVGTSGIDQNIKYNTQAKYTDSDKSGAAKLFNSLLTDPKIALLYNKSRKIYGDSQFGLGAARWITLGVVFVTNREYGDALHLAQRDMNMDAKGIYELTKKNIGEIRKDPFLYQMAANMIYQLNVSPEEKGELFNKELAFQIENLRETPSDSFWVSVNNLTLHRQAGASAEALERSLKESISKSGGSRQIIEEVKTVAQSFYPEMTF